MQTARSCKVRITKPDQCCTPLLLNAAAMPVPGLRRLQRVNMFWPCSSQWATTACQLPSLLPVVQQAYGCQPQDSRRHIRRPVQAPICSRTLASSLSALLRLCITLMGGACPDSQAGRLAVYGSQVSSSMQVLRLASRCAWTARSPARRARWELPSALCLARCLGSPRTGSLVCLVRLSQSVATVRQTRCGSCTRDGRVLLVSTRQTLRAVLVQRYQSADMCMRLW